MQDNAQEAAVDGEPAVVVDEAKLFELVHEMTDARPGGADHLRQTLLIDSGDDWFGTAFFAKTRKQQENPSQPLIARVEKLVNKILFITDVAREQTCDE